MTLYTDHLERAAANSPFVVEGVEVSSGTIYVDFVCDCWTSNKMDNIYSNVSTHCNVGHLSY